MSTKGKKTTVSAETPTVEEAKDIVNDTTAELPKKNWCHRGPHVHKFLLLHPFANKPHAGIFTSSKKPYNVSAVILNDDLLRKYTLQ